MFRTASSNPLSSWVLRLPSASAADSSSSDTIPNSLLQSLILLEADYTTFPLKNDLPESFEPQKSIWKNLLIKPSDQGICGSCWAFASSACLTDRFNVILQKPLFHDTLSPTIQILCNDLFSILNENLDLKSKFLEIFHFNPFSLNNFGCYGNSLVIACLYLKLLGSPKLECFPYNTNIYNLRLVDTYLGLQKSIDAIGGFGFGERDIDNFQDLSKRTQSLTCFMYNPYSYTYPFKYCLNSYRNYSTYYYGSPCQNFHSLFNYTIKNGVQDVSNIMMDIYRFGPVCSSFIVYQDFYDFRPNDKEAVYIHDDNDSVVIGGHAIEIVGWGMTTNTRIPFWWIKNSWGEKYGQDGYFRFLRGSNHCGIENNVISMMPNFSMDFSDPLLVQKFNQKLLNESVFSIHKNTAPYKSLLKKVLQLNYSNPEILTDSYFDEAFDKYGVFTNEVISSLGFVNTNVPLKNGYHFYHFLYMAGLDYKDNFSKNYDFLFHPSIPSKQAKKSNAILWSLFCLILLLFVFLLFYRFI